MTPDNFPHRVEHTTNKHSRAVYTNNTIVIRLAKDLSKTEEQEHVEDLLSRMTEQLLEEVHAKITINPFARLLNGAQQELVTLATGKSYLFNLQPGDKLKAEKTGKGWLVTVGPKTRRESLHRFLWKLLSQSENARITMLIDKINRQTYRVHVPRIRFAFATSQWGSCSPRGTIMINTALLFVPHYLLHYVIVHELAHRKRGDHSAAYWKIVERQLPSYRTAVENLLEYQLPNL
ncbi:MAG: M48 family metallopeptidase [bacterium]|nr:M48 family metallopeptidase [bacterium]